jgi:hypothetical protein
MRRGGDAVKMRSGGLEVALGLVAVLYTAAGEGMDMEAYLQHDMTHVVIRQAPKGRYAMYGGLTKLPDVEIFCVYKVGKFRGHHIHLLNN